MASCLWFGLCLLLFAICSLLRAERPAPQPCSYWTFIHSILRVASYWWGWRTLVELSSVLLGLVLSNVFGLEHLD